MADSGVRGRVHQELEDVMSISVSKFKQVSSLQQKDVCEVLGGQKSINHERTNGSFVVDFS